jgi:plastocyanin domain-containing protein
MKRVIVSTCIGLGLLLGADAIVAAFPEPSAQHVDQHSQPRSEPFQSIEQPLQNKVAVTIGGLGLIGLELWWFLLKPSPKQKSSKGV